MKFSEVSEVICPVELGKIGESDLGHVEPCHVVLWILGLVANVNCLLLTLKDS